MDTGRPTLHVFVAFPLCNDVFSEPALVSLELALELKQRGYQVVGPDPADEEELAAYERLMRAPNKRKWFEAD